MNVILFYLTFPFYVTRLLLSINVWKFIYVTIKAISIFIVSTALIPFKMFFDGISKSNYLIRLGIILAITILLIIVNLYPIIALIYFYCLLSSLENNKETNDTYKETETIDESYSDMTPYMSKEDYLNYLNSDRWKELREKVLYRDLYTCQYCNEDLFYKHIVTNVHHKTYLRLGNERLSDLISLCQSCHKLHHDSKINVNNIEYKPKTLEYYNNILKTKERELTMGEYTDMMILEKQLEGSNNDNS